MAKLAEEIWKTIVFSLILVTVVLSVLHYLERENWWKLEITNEDATKTPLVYYFVKGEENNTETKADLLVKKNIQEEKVGSVGVFENLLPGQSFSLKINSGNHTIRTPSYIIEDREIKLLVFEKVGEELVFVKSSSRKRKANFPQAINFDSSENLLSKIEKALIENYNPVGREAKAKGQKEFAQNEKKTERENFNNFLGEEKNYCWGF